ncbi:hypothetical protein [Pseudoduganella sp. HUAS MS19]
MDLGQSLAMWGHLSVVPVLLETLSKIARFEDSRHLVTMLSLMLEAKPGEISDADGLEDSEGYASKVGRRVDDIVLRLGTSDAIVMFGELFSVGKLVDVMRRALSDGTWFNPYWRHKFEATTGVNCSGFYRDQDLQPLQALAILEDFEDQGTAGRFVPGRRYFFGHPVPD